MYFIIISLLVQNVVSLSESNNLNNNNGLIQDQEKYIVVEKSFIPSKEFYSIGDEIRVCVEIKNKFKYVSEPFFNAIIYEIVDHELNVTKKSVSVYKTSNIKNLTEYYESLSAEKPMHFCSPDNDCSSYSFDWYTNSQATINVLDAIKGQDRLLYWYNITPQSNGDFEIRTIFRADYFSDFEDTQKIKVRKAELDLNVLPIVDKNLLIQSEQFQIKYYVSAINGSDLAKNVRISIELGDPKLKNEYFEIIDGPKSENPTMNGSETFTWKIAYPQVGKFRAPGITINGKYYPSSDIITVESFFAKNFNIISEFVALLMIITTLISIYIHFKTGSLRRQLKKFYIRHYYALFFISLIALFLSIYSLSAQINPKLDSIDIYIIKNWWYISIFIYIFILLLSLTSLRRISELFGGNHVFTWTDIPGKDEGKLREFLIERYGIDWAKTAIIEKIDNGKIIEVSANGKILSLKLNDENTEVIFDNYRTIKFIAEMENDRLNIYDGMTDNRLGITALLPRIDMILLISIAIIVFGIILLNVL